MAEAESLALYRKFWVISKHDDDMFKVRYVVTSQKSGKREEGSSSRQQREVSQEYAKQPSKEAVKEGDKRGEQGKPYHHANRLEEGKAPKPKYKGKQHKKEYRLKPELEAISAKVDQQEGNSAGEAEGVEQKAEKEQKSKEKYSMIEQLAQPEDEKESDHQNPQPQSTKKEQMKPIEPQDINYPREQGQDEDEIFQKLEQMQLKSKFSQYKEPFSGVDLANSTLRDGRKLYDAYTELQTIEESRADNERIYFRGIVQFSDTIKWYCNIISRELQGVLVAEGRNTNRAVHEDEVYFRVDSEGKEKILCTIVAIAKRRINEVVGKIEFNKNKQIYLLKPTNAKFPSMNINPAEIKKQWSENLYTKYFLVEFAYWNASDDHPFCRILGQYGNFGSVQIQTEALLKNYGIDNRALEQKETVELMGGIAKSLNEKGEYVIEQEQMKRRKDFRRWRTFIVRDSEFDTAFSIAPLNLRGKADPNFLKKNIFQVNVHFSDYAFFVPENSALDGLARQRLTSYNLVHHSLPLFPEPLSSICKLRQNKDTLTISVSFQIDEEGNILEMSKIAKSIINPTFAFSTDELQRVLSADVPFEEWKGWNCGCKMQSEFKVISADVKLINKLIAKRRQKRIESGALAFQVPIKDLKFDETLNPTHFQLKHKNEATYMIEQCVISASMKVGEFLFKNLKSKAILYRHRFPGFKRLNKFKELLKKMGQSLPQNSKEIQKYINEMIANGQIKQCIKDTIKYQTIRLLQSCDFFQVLNSDPLVWVHYAINTPIYTHCSSPSKSYGDLLVQRQVASVLDKTPWKMEQKETGDVLEQCNKSKLVMGQIRKGCEKIFLCLYLRNNPVFTTAVLTEIQEWGIKLLVPKFNLKTMIKFKHLKTIKVAKTSLDENSRKNVKIDFTSEKGDFKTKIVLKEMQEINIRIGSANSYPLDYAFNIVLPHPTEEQQKVLIS